MVAVGAQAGLPVVDVFPNRDVWAELLAAVSGNADAAQLPEAAGAADLSALGTVPGNVQTVGFQSGLALHSAA
ncbi:MAG: hypothetical protein JO287_15180 [Pseudonocardiales bacterium]|nr:hypothetical protein [Pseudonocardiales bacterium]